MKPIWNLLVFAPAILAIYVADHCNNELQPFGPFEGCVPLWRVAIGAISILGGVLFAITGKSHRRFICGMGIFAAGVIIWSTGHEPC